MNQIIVAHCIFAFNLRNIYHLMGDSVVEEPLTLLNHLATQMSDPYTRLSDS